MSKRLLIDEHVRARELFVHEGRSLADISLELGVHIITLRRWVKKEGWMSMRRDASTTPLEIGRRIRKILAQLLDEIDKKLEAKEPINDRLLMRLDKYSRALVRLADDTIDERAAAIFAMDKYIRYLADLKDQDALKMLHRTLPSFYRKLGEGKL